jgi:hypothetical protein
MPLREQLAWNLLKTGKLEAASEMFTYLAGQQLEPSLRASVLLGLGCLANRSSRQRQPGARMHAATSIGAAAMAGPDADEEEQDDDMRTRVAAVRLEDLALVESQPGEMSDCGEGEFDLAVNIDSDVSGWTETNGDIPRGMGVAWRMGIKGDIGHFALGELVQFLGASRRTGTLVVTSEHGIGAVHLQGGKITGAMSPRCPNIGDILLRDGIISEEQLSQATKAQKKSLAGRLLGAILISMTGIEIQHVQDALAQQVVHAVQELLGWEAGRFAFEPERRTGGKRECDSDPDILLDVQWVLLEAYRMLDERQAKEQDLS